MRFVACMNISKFDKKGRKKSGLLFFCCPLINKNTARRRQRLEGEKQQECHHKTEETHGF